MKRIIVMVLTIVFLMILPGCGVFVSSDKGAEEPDIAENGKAPVASWEDTGAAMRTGAILIGDTLFYMEGEWDQERQMSINVTIYREKKGQEGEVLAELGDSGLLFFLADREEAVYCFYISEKEDMEYHLRKVDRTGSLIYDISVEEPESGEDLLAYARMRTVTMGQVSGLGEVCLSNAAGDLYLFNAEGHLSQIGRADWDEISYNGLECGLVNAGEEGIFTYRIEDENVMLRRVHMQDGKLQDALMVRMGKEKELSIDPVIKDASVLPGSLDLYNGYDMGVLLSDSEVLWRYDVACGKLEKVLDWGDSKINLRGYMIDAIGILPGDEYYVMAHQSYGDVAFAHIDFRDRDEIPEKRTITVGLLQNDELMQEIVSEMASKFNKQSSDYQIEIQYSESWTDFHLELIQGEGADLLCLSDMDIVVLADKGVLEDLSPYFAESDIVKESDLLPSVVRAGNIGGKLVCVFPYYQVNGFWVRKEMAEGHGWTVDDYLTMGENFPEASLQSGNPKYFHNNILKLMIQSDMDSYVDWENRECHFDTEEFIALVERVKKLTPPDSLITDYSLNREAFLQGEYLTQNFFMNGIYSNELISANGGLTNGDMLEVKGYPNKSGEPLFDFVSLSLWGMNSASENKAGAWEFLEFILSEEYQSRMNSFSVRRDVFERQLSVEKYFGSDLEFSEDDREFVRLMVDNAYMSSGSEALDISVMISEELALVWEDAKDIEEAVEILQNRVLLYLQE